MRPDASPEEVRKAYLRLARQHHPDYFVDAPPHERAAAEARMRAVNDAWAAIGDAARRPVERAAPPRPFQPFEAPMEGEPDPRDQPDVPYRPVRPATTRSRAATLAPAVLLGGALGAGVVAIVTGAELALGCAIVLLGSAAIGFVALPVLALGRAKRDEG